jgi:hypothetical protein
MRERVGVSSQLSEINELTPMVSRGVLHRWFLEELPAELGNLTKLTWVKLDVNPLSIPPAQVMKKGPRAIVAYVRTHPSARPDTF